MEVRRSGRKGRGEEDGEREVKSGRMGKQSEDGDRRKG